MKTCFAVGSIVSVLFTLAAVAEDKGIKDVAKSPAPIIRIRSNDISGWTSDNDSSLVITTKRRQRFLIEFERSCFNLRRGSEDNILLTDSSSIDRHSGIRLMDRFALDQQLMHRGTHGFDFIQTSNALSSYCPIKEITALGRVEKKKEA